VGETIPNRLIRHDNLAPVLDLVRNRLELARHDLNRLARLALLEALAAAQNHADAAVERRLGLGRHKRVVFLQDHAALRVPDERPGNAAVLELLGRDLAREGAAGLVEDVLGRDFEAFAELLARGNQVDGGGCDDDLCDKC
jgi:hypothetical protein